MTTQLKRIGVEVRGRHWATSKAVVEQVLRQRTTARTSRPLAPAGTR